MVTQCVNFWVQALLGVWNIFTQLLGATGMTGVYLAMFSAVVAFRLLIVPIIGSSGGSGSDEAKAKK